MVFRSWRTFLAVTVLLLLVFSTIPGGLQAQDDGEGLSEEETAILDRLVAAADQFNSLSSYTENSTDIQFSQMVVSVGNDDNAVSLSSEINSEVNSTTTFIRGEENNNVQVNIENATETITESTFDEEVITTYALSGEIRSVDGVVYANVDYVTIEDPKEMLETLPEDWIEMERVSAIPVALDLLDLDRLFARPGEVNDVSDLLFTEEMLEQVVTSATATPGDGGEVMELTIDFERLVSMIPNFIVENQDEVTQSILEQAFDDAQILMRVTLDASANITQIDYQLDIAVEPPVDLHALAPDQYPENATFSFQISLDETLTYSDFNASFEPVVAPEIPEEAEEE